MLQKVFSFLGTFLLTSTLLLFYSPALNPASAACTCSGSTPSGSCTGLSESQCIYSPEDGWNCQWSCTPTTTPIPTTAPITCFCSCPTGGKYPDDCTITSHTCPENYSPVISNTTITSDPLASCGCKCLGNRFCVDADGPTTYKPVEPVYIYTALGCLPTGAKELITILLRILSGVGGGIALLMIIFSASMIMTAGGDPKKVQAGRELLTAALAGLSFIVLAVLILNFVGVNVLGISKLGFNL